MKGDRIQHRKGTIIFVSLAAILMIAALLVGIDDNPPGALLAALSGAALVVAFVHHWRSPKRFLALSAICIVVIVALGQLAVGIDITLTTYRVTGPVAQVLDVVGTAIALSLAFLAVPAIFVGLIGAVVVWLVGRARPEQPAQKGPDTE